MPRTPSRSVAASAPVRTAARRAGWPGGFVQANLAILPAAYADEFARFCQRNPKPCPLLAMSEPGSPHLPELAEDLDLRTDVPSYRVFRDGEVDGDLSSIGELWRDDLVAFALGCSFSFEEALVDAGLPVRHWNGGSVCPMYLTDIECAPAGRFRSRMVVSMRPFTPADAIRAVQITSRYPRVHGAPVHLGMPERIGIADIERAWQGDDPLIGAGELPVFWACGVTPQVALRAARPPHRDHPHPGPHAGHGRPQRLARGRLTRQALVGAGCGGPFLGVAAGRLMRRPGVGARRTVRARQGG